MASRAARDAKQQRRSAARAAPCDRSLLDLPDEILEIIVARLVCPPTKLELKADAYAASAGLALSSVSGLLLVGPEWRAKGLIEAPVTWPPAAPTQPAPGPRHQLDADMGEAGAHAGAMASAVPTNHAAVVDVEAILLTGSAASRGHSQQLLELQLLQNSHEYLAQQVCKQVEQQQHLEGLAAVAEVPVRRPFDLAALTAAAKARRAERRAWIKTRDAMAKWRLREDDIELLDRIKEPRPMGMWQPSWNNRYMIREGDAAQAARIRFRGNVVQFTGWREPPPLSEEDLRRAHLEWQLRRLGRRHGRRALMALAPAQRFIKTGRVMGFYVEFGGKVPSASHAARATHVAACLVERGMGAPDCAALYRFVWFIRDGGAVEDVPAALDKEQRTREVAQAIAAAQLPVLFSDHDLFRAYIDGGPTAPGVMAPAAAAAEILARRTEAEERCARCGVDLDGPLPDLAGSIDGWVARGGARCDLKEENLCGMGEARYKELMRIADTEVLNQRAIEKRRKARLPEKHLPGFQERYRAWAAAGFGDGFEELLASIVESEGRAHAAELAEKTRRTQGARLRREAGLPAEYLHTFFADRWDSYFKTDHHGPTSGPEALRRLLADECAAEARGRRVAALRAAAGLRDLTRLPINKQPRMRFDAYINEGGDERWIKQLIAFEAGGGRGVPDLPPKGVPRPPAGHVHKCRACLRSDAAKGCAALCCAACCNAEVCKRHRNPEKGPVAEKKD